MECFFIVAVGWVFSVCLHEFGHAWVAYKGGDFTVEEKGYLTLNPLRYTHPLFSLVLPMVFLVLGGIGLPGGAVYINDSLLRSRAWRTGVSLAGPAANLVLAFVIAAFFATGVVRSDPTNILSISLAFLFLLQISAILLNLIPVPPLDGFRAIAPWLPEELSDRIMGFANFGILLLFVALWYVEPFNALFWGTVRNISSAMGVPPELAAFGYREFRFWDRAF